MTNEIFPPEWVCYFGVYRMGNLRREIRKR